MAHEFKDWFDEYELLPESEADLCSWNDEDVAFIKNDVHDGKSMWLIYAADGTKNCRHRRPGLCLCYGQAE